jgi:hypothetical protein
VIGDLTIEVLGREHFCTVCDRFSWRCFSRHRSGILYILRVSASYEKPALLLLSQGEFKEIRTLKVERVLGDLVRARMSGTRIYEHGKITAAGWISFEPAVLPLREEDINIDALGTGTLSLLSLEERDLLNMLLAEHKVRVVAEYLRALHEENPSAMTQERAHSLIETIDLGVWTHIKPIIHTFISGNIYHVGGMIFFREFSFTAKFECGSIVFYFTKAKPKVEEQAGNITRIRLGEKGRREIYVLRYGDRVSVYYVRPDAVFAFEQYRGHVHPRAVLDREYFEEKKELLFKKRLGDILFVPEEGIDLEKAEKEREMPSWIGKVEILKGEVWRVKVNPVRCEYYLANPPEGDIVLYHPEHGVLVLPRLGVGAYRIEPVRYRTSGHD